MKLSFENQSIGLKSNWLPTAYVDTAEGLSKDTLEEAGLDDVELLATDIDGTVMNYHEGELPAWAKDMYRRLGDEGISRAVLSNAYGLRVPQIHDMFSFDPSIRIYTPDVVTPEGENPKRNGKPKTAMLERAAEDHGIVDRRKILILGDQAMKDVLVAGRSGARSLQVNRLGKGDDPRVKWLQRPFAEFPSRVIHTGVQFSNGRVRRIGTPILARNFPDKITLTRPPVERNLDTAA